jgi:hypothetical protein
MGLDGWELVTVAIYPSMKFTAYEFYFKRPIE